MWQGLLAGLIHAGGAPGVLYEYLAGEVFDRLSPPLRRFLLESAVPRQFTAQLCNDLRAVSASEVWIEQAESRNLYLTRVETEGVTWFRYHHLFREFLIARFKRDDPAGLARLHLRAGELFESRHQPEEAVEHYLAAGAPDRAARVMDAAARRLFIAGRTQTLQNWYERLPVKYQTLAPELVLFQGQALIDSGRPGEALAVLKRSETGFRRREDVIGQIRAVLPQGWGHYAQGKMRDALAVGEDVLKRLEQDSIEELHLKAQALRLLGDAHCQLGQWQTGEGFLVEALTLSRHSNQDERRAYNLGRVLQDLAYALRILGRLEEASIHQSEALAIWRQIGNPGPLAESLNNAGYDRLLIGDYDGALALYREALAAAEEIDDKRIQTGVLESMASVYRDRREFQRAIQIYDEVIEMAHSASDKWFVNWALDGLGHVYRLMGNTDRALSLFEQAKRLAERDENRLQVSISTASSGIAKVEQRLFSDGIAELERALNVFRASESHLDLARVLFWLARAYYDNGQYSEAKRSLAEMLRFGSRLGCRPFSLAEGLHAEEILVWGVEQFDTDTQLRAWLSELRIQAASPRGVPQIEVVAEPRIEVRAFGPGQVFRDGRLLTSSDWGGSAIARELLFHMLERSPQRKEEIGATFWPELSLPRMTNSFHAAKYRTRRAVGVEFVIYEADTYRVNPAANIWYDVDEFNRRLDSAQRRSEDELDVAADLQAAANLYTGDYLTSIYSDWVLEPRQVLRTRYLHAINQLLDVLLSRGEHEHAIELCRQGIEFDYYQENLHRGLMWGLAATGRRAEALAHYQEFARRLRKELRASPAQETKEIITRIRTR
jgi:DNA-binding SARP family transcriptional activator